MRRFRMVILAAAVLLSFAACEDGGTTPPDDGDGDGGGARTSLETIQAFRDALNSRDTGSLENLLTDGFRFYFDEDDVGETVGDYTIPTSCNGSVFLCAVGNMLKSAYAVSFYFDESDVGGPAEGDTTYETGEVDISLTVMLDSLNGFLVTGSVTFRFWLDSSAEDEVWLLSNMKDFTSYGAGSESFGKILAFYYQQESGEGRPPAGTLKALEKSFNASDIDLFKDVLAPEMAFHFDASDVGSWVGDYEIPETWGYDELISAVGNMFDQVYSIDFTVSTGNVGEPDEGADEFFANNVQVRLLVMIDSTNGYLAQGFCGFRFINTGTGDNDDWVISDWWDYTAVGGVQELLEPVSLGKILALFK
jgi:hypothetical protein